MRLQLRQWHVFTLLWIQVLSYPVVANYLEGKGVQWQGVLDDWLRFIPFFVLFLLHNFIAIPRFLIPRRITAYLITTVLLLGLFLGSQRLRDVYISGKEGSQPVCVEEQHNVPPPLPPEGQGGDGQRPPEERPEDGQRPPERRPEDGRHPPRHDKEGDFHFLMMDFVFAVLMLGCNIMVVLLFQIKKAREKAERLERINMQHELKYLKAQFSPHFLMNTLNNIHGMIEVDPVRAQDMVISLSKLLRYALYEGSDAAVPLTMEMAFIFNYVHLRMQGYSEKKLSVNLSLPQQVPAELTVPPLLFVVFIENAFKHGVSYRHPSFVDIAVKVEDGRITFYCENSVPPAVSGGREKKGGIGLDNVRKRLELLFGDDYTLSIENKPDVYQVTLNIPVYDNEHTMPRY